MTKHPTCSAALSTRAVATLAILLAVAIAAGCGSEPAERGAGPEPLPDAGGEDGGPTVPRPSEPTTAERSPRPVAMVEASFPEFAFELERLTVTAGESVEYTTAVEHGGADVTEAWEIAVSIEPPEGAEVRDGSLRFTAVGRYHVAASATRDGIVFEESADVVVVPGEPAVATIVATPDTVRAGERVAFALSVQDDEGNELPSGSYDARLAIEPGGHTVSVDDPGIELTEAGRYEVEASIGDGTVEASAFFVVTPGPAAHLDLTLGDATNVSPGDTVDYDIEVTDEFGNDLPFPGVEVSTDPEEGGSAEAIWIRFEREGVYEVVARIPGTELEDREGPVVVDGFGPIIAVETPERAAYVPVAPVAVRGRIWDNVSNVERAVLLGDPLSLGAEGAFESSISTDAGINVITIQAWDTRGHRSGVAQSVLAGNAFVPSGDRAGRSLIARVNQSTIDVIESFAENSFDEAQVRDLVLSNPRIWSDCVDLWLTSLCARAEVRSFSMTGLDVELTPRDGYLDLSAAVLNPRVGVAVRGDASVDGTVTARAGRLTGQLRLRVAGDRLVADVSNVRVSLDGFHISIGLPDWLDFIEDLISDWTRGTVEDAIRDAIVDQVPAAINDALSDLEIAETLDIAGVAIRIEAIPQSVAIQSTGLTLTLQSVVRPVTPLPEMAGPGALYTDTPSPSYGATPGFVLSISDDFLNQALYALWEAGIVGDISDDFLADVDLSALQTIVPTADSFRLELDPLLPPVFRPATTDGAMGELQVGDLVLFLYGVDEDSDKDTLIAEVAVTAFADVNVGTTSANTVLVELVGDPRLHFDGISSTIPNLDSERVEEALELLVPILLPEIAGFLEEFPIPSFEGFTIASPGVGLAGPAGDYVNISGELTRR